MRATAKRVGPLGRRSIQGRNGFIRRLERAGTKVEPLTREVERSPTLLKVAVTQIRPEAGCARFGASKLLRILSERRPELVYPHFDFLAGLLKNENSFLRWNAMLTLGNLAAVDRNKKLDAIIAAYLAPIAGPVMIDAANTIRGAVAIARAKPYLADTIATHILQVENATYATPECRNVAIGHAITALNQIFPLLTNKEHVQLFAARQADNARHATGSKAQRFCKRWTTP